MNNSPCDLFADLIDLPVSIPLDFLPEIQDHNDPAYLVEELEIENIRLFGCNLNGVIA